eukprot:318327-Pleurochrysis_carterae.AAC.1
MTRDIHRGLLSDGGPVGRLCFPLTLRVASFDRGRLSCLVMIVFRKKRGFRIRDGWGTAR